MGKGKGQPEFWVAVIKPGTIIFELDGLAEVDAKECFRLAASKLPMRNRFVTRERKLVF
jgi:large subunit ribosomal protein L16